MKVIVKDKDVEAAIRTFKKRVSKEGILQEVRKRSYYVKPGVKKRLKHEQALKARRKAKKF